MTSGRRGGTRTIALGLAMLVSAGAAAGAGRDGRDFDPGIAMTARASGAPEALDRVAPLLGRWAVEQRVPDGEAEKVTACRAEITWFNRGHGLRERLVCGDGEVDSGGSSALGYLVYNPGAELWLWGEADNLTESVRVAQGRFDGEHLVLSDAVRRGGGIRLIERRYRLSGLGGEELTITVDESGDGGASWQPVRSRVYRPLGEGQEGPPPPGDGLGEPAPGLPAEAREFDFLLGRWTSSHAMTTPTGQRFQWQSRSTAVRALNGAAIVEFDQFDVDPRLPDAATTIVRIYNRAMRRWESLYLPNRGHGMLYFGGRREGDRIVLHPFGTDTASPTGISRYVFHDIGEEAYAWYSETSTDRGASFSKSWTIEVERLESASGEARAKRASE